MKTLIVDMDDVLAETSTKILQIFNEKNGLNLNKEYFNDKNFYEILKDQKFKTYREELFKPGFFGNLDVIPDSQQILKILSEKYEIYIVSAAVEFPNSLKEKLDWLGKYFPFVSWRNIVFCGSKSLIKGDIMIDDHARNFEHFGGQKLLFHAPHNTRETGYTRVMNWKEVYEILE